MGCRLSAVALHRLPHRDAVGARGNGYLVKSNALIEHWDGVRWRVARLPHLPASYLYGISTAGPHSAWAVGATFGSTRATFASGTRPLLLHWNGRSWREQALPWARPGVVLDQVMATGPSSVWAVSNGQENSTGPVVLEHWNGSRWQAAPSPFGATDPFSGFSATAWNDAWAVGSYAGRGNEVTKFSRPLAAHWNGHSWQMTNVPNPPGSDNSFALVSVAATGPDDVLALGESQQIHDVEPAVSASPDGSAWAVGQCREDDFLVRLTPAGWATASHPRDVHWRAGFGRHGRPPSCSSQG